ncbi:MAG: AI-2E family transporter [Vicinamibacterales bacterium]
MSDVVVVGGGPFPAGDASRDAPSVVVAAEDAGPRVPVPVDMRNAALTVLAVIAVLLVLHYAQPVFIPLVLGLLISYALGPVVTRLQKFRVPRAVSAGVLLLALVAGSGYLIYQLRFQVQEIIQQLPDGARRLRRTLEQQQGRTTDALKNVQQAATELEQASNSSGATTARPGVTRVQVEDAPFDVNDYVMWGSFEAFLMVQLFTSAAVGTVSWLAFRAIGLEQAAVWGLLAGIFEDFKGVGELLGD